jgi:hypothetical protein
MTLGELFRALGNRWIAVNCSPTLEHIAQNLSPHVAHQARSMRDSPNVGDRGSSRTAFVTPRQYEVRA